MLWEQLVVRSDWPETHGAEHASGRHYRAQLGSDGVWRLYWSYRASKPAADGNYCGNFRSLEAAQTKAEELER